MLHALTLPQLGPRIKAVDRMMLVLMAHRMLLSHQVGVIKQASTPIIPIFNKDRELERIAECREIAVELGLNPDFAQSILYSIIDESCKLQMIELQSGSCEIPSDVDDSEWRKLLKDNLLKLTARVATNYDQYDKGFSASSLYRDYENAVLVAEIQKVQHHGIAVDLGCATGGKTFELAKYFEQVIGYDISPDMLLVANTKVGLESGQDVSFVQLDLGEEGIPLPDESVSFVLMSLGTASDIPDICKVVSEVQRVLVPGGRFFFSFYNLDALIYQWDFLPWPVSIAAEMNHVINCLDVHFGKEIFSVYARAYSTNDVRTLFSEQLKLEKILTFPTISPILPDKLFQDGKDEKARLALSLLDESLADGGLGAYIIAIGKKEASID